MKRILLSKDWFVRRPNTAYTPVDLPHDGSISLPRDPAAPGGVDTGYFASTDLTYVKHLRIPAEAKHAILDIDGAYMCATVFLNQDQLCVHSGCCSRHGSRPGRCSCRHPCDRSGRPGFPGPGQACGDRPCRPCRYGSCARAGLRCGRCGEDLRREGRRRLVHHRQDFQDHDV